MFAHNDEPLNCAAAPAYDAPIPIRTPSVAFDQNAESSTVNWPFVAYRPLPCCAAPMKPFVSDFDRRNTNDAADPVKPPEITIPDTELLLNVESSIVIAPPLIVNIPFPSDAPAPPP